VILDVLHYDDIRRSFTGCNGEISGLITDVRDYQKVEMWESGKSSNLVSYSYRSLKAERNEQLMNRH